MKKLKRKIINRSFTLIVMIVVSNVMFKFRNVYGWGVVRDIIKVVKSI